MCLPAALLISINRRFISIRFSVLHATASAASVKRPSKILLKVSSSSVRIFFHSVQTKRRYWSFSSFASHCVTTDYLEPKISTIFHILNREKLGNLNKQLLLFLIILKQGHVQQFR